AVLGPGRDPPQARGEDDRRLRPRLLRLGREGDHAAAGGDGGGDPGGRRGARSARHLSVEATMRTMTPETVRDAMVPEPTTLAAGASAQEAGRCFAELRDVRAIF